MYKATHQTHPWLIQQCTSVENNNSYKETPNGLTMYSPLWDPQDWPLTPKGRDLYLAEKFLQKKDPASEIFVQVNGKFFCKVDVAIHASKEVLEFAVLGSEKVKELLKGNVPRFDHKPNLVNIRADV
jgi:hypothetical protein